MDVNPAAGAFPGKPTGLAKPADKLLKRIDSSLRLAYPACPSTSTHITDASPTHPDNLLTDRIVSRISCLISKRNCAPQAPDPVFKV